ncbi:MAG: anti-sigma factor domain-containing protein [Spirulina sp.]
MTGSLSPEQRQLLMAGYVLYDLGAEEAASLEALLAEHPELRDELAHLQATWETACEMVPQAPPAHLRDAILQAATLGQQPQAAVASPDLSSDSPPSANLTGVASPQAMEDGQSWVVVGPGRWWWKGLGAAAALLIVGLSVSNLMLWRALQAVQPTNPAGETLTVALGDPAATPAAKVQINPQTLEGSLTVENLPPLEPGQVYVLWTVVDPNAPVTVDDKNAILTTVFTVDDQGRQSQAIDLPSVYRRDPSLIRAVAITQESADAPQAHRSAPILIQPL